MASQGTCNSYWRASNVCGGFYLAGGQEVWMAKARYWHERLRASLERFSLHGNGHYPTGKVGLHVSEDANATLGLHGARIDPNCDLLPYTKAYPDFHGAVDTLSNRKLNIARFATFSTIAPPYAKTRFITEYNSMPFHVSLHS
ncbi:hypothetical protein Trydic_g6304 [Trypoxylus dichotomus]